MDFLLFFLSSEEKDLLTFGTPFPFNTLSVFFSTSLGSVLDDSDDSSLRPLRLLFFFSWLSSLEDRELLEPLLSLERVAGLLRHSFALINLPMPLEAAVVAFVVCLRTFVYLLLAFAGFLNDDTLPVKVGVVQLLNRPFSVAVIFVFLIIRNLSLVYKNIKKRYLPQSRILFLR